MKFLNPKNRPKALSLYHCNDQEKKDLDLMFDQARVIIAVTNKIVKNLMNMFKMHINIGSQPLENLSISRVQYTGQWLMCQH